MTSKLKNTTSYELFTTVSLIGIAGFFILTAIKGSVLFDWLVIDNNRDKEFLDFYRHVALSARGNDLYITTNSFWGCFPPLAYVIYRAIYEMGRPEGITGFTGLEDQLLVSPYYRLLFLYYTIFTVLLFAYAVISHQKTGHYKRLIVCLLLSAPFLGGGIERGNSVVLVTALLLLASKLKDEASQPKKEIALILIAICAGLKIYPAIFGLLYLKEKRYKEAGRLVIYGITFFFVPFIFFGGAKGFMYWLVHICAVSDFESPGKIEYIKGLTETLELLLTGRTCPMTATLAAGIFLLLMTILFIRSQDKYRSMFFLCCCMAFVPTNSYRYALCYLSIPLVLYLGEKGNETPGLMPGAELTSLAMVFSLPSLWGLITNFRMNFGNLNEELTYAELCIYFFAYLSTILIITNEIKNGQTEIIHKNCEARPLD